MTVAAAIVVLGCAGGGDSGTSGGTDSGGTTGSALRVNIPTPSGHIMPPGRLELGFLTGQGRAIGDLTLVITRASVYDEFGEITNPLAPRTYLALGSYSFQIVPLTIPFTDQNSRLFENYTLDPLEMQEDIGSGAHNTYPDTCFAVRRSDGTLSRAWPPNPIPIVARVFPGRSTSVPIFLDDSMFAITQDPDAPAGDPCGGTVVAFDEARFAAINEPPIRGFINDYVSFDISAMPANERPRMSGLSGGQVVGRVFVSGDNYAISNQGLSGDFEVLTPQVEAPIKGNFGPPGTIGGSTHPGTFTLLQLDPTDLFNLRKIVALQGIWREYDAVVSGFSTWNMVTFPNTDDANIQEVVYFQRDGNGVISNFFFGYVDLDLDEAHLFPVDTLVSGIINPSEEAIVHIDSQIDKHGVPTNASQLTRSGTFSVSVQGGLPSDAAGSGNYLVFRI
ncbi:MAG TPA: hypothetical protein VK934_13565 [Fimbriimonas sp.]|nr:hypothetical protein [Fimbriimonas sp.]